MKKRLAILLATLAGTWSVSAAPLSSPQKEEIIERINRAAAGLKSMSCSFSQTKSLSLLSDKMVSEGKMDYRQPDKLRWEYTSPYRYLFLLNGSRVFVGNGARKDVIDTNTNKVFKEVARIMMSTVTGTALSNESDFAVDMADGGTAWQVTLVPKKKEMKSLFSSIVLFFNKSNLMIAAIDIYEKNQDRTHIQLRNITSDRPIDENLFAIPE